MYGSQSTFRPRGGAGRGRGGRGGRGPPQNPQPNYFPINTIPSIPSLTLPSVHCQQLNPSFQTSPCFNPPRFITREMVEAAVDKARRDLLSSGENVSVWKVSQSAALALQVSSWDSIGFRFSDIPCLRDLQFVEGKVNAFIHCFVTVRRMTSVHELGLEICKSEGVEEFVDLGLGPLVRHPLVRQYFLIPPDLKEVCPIRIDDLVSRLSVFLYKVKNKEFSVEEFLDFLMQKYSVPARENLGVRIQSMGLYIKFIKGARRAESSSLSSIQERGLVTEQPKVLTYPIPNNLNSMSSLCDEYIGETREEAGNFDFGMIDSAHFNRCCQCCPARKKKGKKHGSCKCSASPFFDDLKLIGIKLALFNHASNGKIPAGNDMKTGGYGAAAYEIMKVDQLRSNQLILSNKQIDGFIETWKGACLKHSVDEVLAMMLSTYRATEKQKKKMQRLFLQYPAVGLLNMAVRVLKGENIDVLLHPPDEPASINESSTSFVEQVKSESSSDSEPMSDDEKCVPSIENCVSLDFVIKKIGCYFQIDAAFRRKDLTLEKQLILRDCELWLKKQFSVDDFGCLGHGNFLDFVEKHSSALTSEAKYFLTGVFGNKPSMRVFMSEKHFLTLLSQAARNFEKASELTEKDVSMLLRKQFPAIVLHTSDIGLGESLNLMNEQSLYDVSSFSLAFSASLLGTGRSSFSEGNFSSENAVECLLRAPMLSDLQLWSHWDLVFGPSLGPLLDWLIDLGYVKGLSCIATADGRIIRIDHSVTLDGFLEAIAKGSSFQTAVNLLSLFHLYGGSKRIPLSLIRCYAQAGIDSIIKSCTEKLQANAQETFYEHKNSQCDQEVFSTSNEHGNAQSSSSNVGENAERNRIYAEVFCVNKAHATVSLFILSCLGYQPPEFRSFTAEILVTAFQFFARDAKMIVLKGCRGVNERIMLHEIGLDLGIIDWIEDYKEYSSATSADTFQSSGRGGTKLGEYSTEDNENLAGNVLSEVGEKNQEHLEAHVGLIDSHMESLCSLDTSCDQSLLSHASLRPGDSRMQAAALFVERIRREEFGLDSDLGSIERNLLKKQHARLGRALHCLSRELYSQDCHFILELVQNADDNNYQENVEPTLVFIVHSDRIVILNNELGFSDKNIRALCDVGNSTKKGSSGGYIGQKGIGFKSVFRITDAPEIHSNGFHVKFDITEGQIGFVLPTIIPPCDVGYYTSVTDNSDQSDSTAWNTCIVLPFKSGLKQGKGHCSIISMFSDLHPSLLLFLHRLNCIVFKSIIEEKLVIMRRKILSDGIVMVSQGTEKLSWLVVSKSLEASLVRPDVQTTKIAMAFPLEQSGNGDYIPLLDQQPVFAFLPLRKYGLKFIIQGDFVLPSSREEVDEDSAWNQWLLSEMPDLFALAEKSFCALPCFKENPAKAITTFMSFVPLVGEVHGFFSPLPHMILSKLRISNCLLVEGPIVERAPPFAVLRNWSKDLRTFLTEDLLLQHLGLYYLLKDIRLSDNLSRAMGIQEYGPRTLIGLLSSICHGNGINVLGLEWISSWLKAFHVTLIDNSSGHLSSGNADIGSDLFDSLGRIPFIPLSDGSYSSLEKGPIWFPCNIFNMGSQSENVFGNLPGLFAELRTVNSLLFSNGMTPAIEESRAATVVKVLERIGVQKLSAHDVIRSHILPSIYEGKTVNKNMDLMIEYLIYVIFHLQSSCIVCKTERGEILHGLKKHITLLTNHGSICPAVEPIHFGNEFGNAFNVKELVDDMNIKWNEVDTIYLKHPSSRSLSLGLMTWREFFQELGVTDFVQVNQVQRNVGVYAFSDLKCPPCYQDATSVDMLVNDWESPEMISILSSLSSNKCLQKSRYLLEILDKMWDDLFSTKARCQSLFLANEQKEPLQSSFMKCIGNFKWVACSIDEEVHYPKDLFYDCELVHSLLGAGAPYAAPLVTSKRLVEDIGFKVTVTLDDALRVLQSWRTTDCNVASVSQMSKFYAYISEELGKSDGKIIKKVKEHVSIFIPFSDNFNHVDVVSGAFMLPHQLYWHDPTGCLNRIREAGNSYIFANEGDYIPSITLDVLYPELHDFLVTVCGVYETPPSCHYFQILFHLSSIALPSEVALLVFKLMLKWSNDLNSGVCQDEDVLELKEKLLKPESTVLPTVQDKWVSLHPRFGPIYWSDDEKLINEYAHLSNINFLNFGQLDEGEKELLSGQVAVLLKKIGIPVLAEVVSREAIFYGVADSTKEAFLINWILPYAQRYLYKQHADIYCNLKESGFLRIMQLQVILVEKLFYRNTLQGNSSTKQKRYECRSLLEDTRLYTTPHADTHTMFLELSRLFFEGTPDLQMANFLYIVAKEFGSAEDEVEFLVVNNLEVPLLPEGETIWSLDGSQKLNAVVSSTQATSVYKRQYPTPRKKTSAKLNWPPTKESTPNSNADHLRIPNEKQSVDASAGDSLIPTEADGMIPTFSERNKSDAYRSVKTLLPYAIEDISSSSTPVDTFSTPSSSATNDASSGSMHVESFPTSVSYLHDETLLEFKNRDRLLLEAPEEEQSYKTGRLGEMVAYQFFCHKLGRASVQWINEKSEMGLPYDLVVKEKIATRYVEVKATSSATKDWFSISINEWYCALEKGESYSIAWVILSSQSDAQVHVFNNPLKLCQQKLLQLAILLPKASPNSLQF